MWEMAAYWIFACSPAPIMDKMEVCRFAKYRVATAEAAPVFIAVNVLTWIMACAWPVSALNSQIAHTTVGNPFCAQVGKLAVSFSVK